MTAVLNSPNRRTVLKNIGIGTAGLVSALGLIGSASAACTRPERTRRDVNDPTFGPSAAKAYRDAVMKVKALPSSDARNWLNLANIHRNFCPHGNWYFLPWHRAYLLAVEDIFAEVTGDPSFALPYWNWSKDRQLPRPFVDETIDGVPNPLFHRTRAMGKSDTLTSRLSQFGMDAEVIFGANNLAAIGNEPTFQQFGSIKPAAQDSIDVKWQRAAGTKTKLESEPHDYLHGAVGGDMGDPAVSAKDPIFYLHHCNIDRIWDRWSVTHANDVDPLWRNFVFKRNFPTAAGGEGGDVTVSSVGSADAWCYAYDTNPAPHATTAAPKKLAKLSLQTVDVGGLPGRVRIASASEAAFILSDDKRGKLATTVTKNDGRILAFINDVQPPKDKQVNVRVFVNCDYLTPLTPADDMHYAGGFTFFVMAHHEMAQSFAVDLTNALRRSGMPSDTNSLRVQLMPVTYTGKPAEGDGFKVGSIAIKVT